MRLSRVKVCFGLVVVLMPVVLVGCAAPSPTAPPVQVTIHLSAIQSPTPAPDPYEEGLARRRAGDVQGALEAFSLALALDPGYVPALVQRGALYLALGEAEAALADAQAAVAADPDTGTGHALLGEVLYLGFGDPVQAMAAYEKAVDLDPTLAEETFLSRWRVAEAAGGADQLAALASEYTDAHPGGPLSSYYQGRALLAIGAARPAIQRLTEALEQGGPAAVWFVLGEAYAADGAWSQAKICYEQAQSLVDGGDTTLNLVSNSPMVDLFVALGMAYLYTGECERARAVLEHALALEPGQPEGSTLLGRAIICQMMPAPTPTAVP